MDTSVSGAGSGGRQFHFVRRIGTGGFGEVYLAEMSTASGFTKMVAIKLLKGDVQGNQGVAERMRDEARLLGMLRHRAIVQADDLITLSGRVAVVMEYVPGCNFSTVIHPELNPAPIPPRAILAIIRNVANALDVAYHRPSTVTGKPLEVLHRDIKPGNVRITPDGEVKVLDFGIARSEGIAREAHTTEYQLGSLNYMAPELLVGGDASPASDIYSLGVTLYEAITRTRFGWAGEDETLHNTKVDGRVGAMDLSGFGDTAVEVAKFVRSLLEFDSAARPDPKDVLDICRELERRTAGRGIEEWARDVVGSLRDVEDDVEGEAGEFTGRIMFEDDSSAMAITHHGIDFLEDQTIALTADEDAKASPAVKVGARSRVQDAMILILLLAVTSMVGWTQMMQRNPDHSLSDRRDPVRPRATESTAAPVVIATISVSIASEPMGIEVLVDDVARGVTPVNGLPLLPGVHTLTFLDGGRTVSEQITVAEEGARAWIFDQATGQVK